jgi:hypothetical protein
MVSSEALKLNELLRNAPKAVDIDLTPARGRRARRGHDLGARRRAFRGRSHAPGTASR